MAYNESGRSEESVGISFDTILRFVKVIVAKWWVILVLVLVFACAGYGYSVLSYTESYTSRMVLAAYNKSNDIEGEPSKYLTQSDMAASATLANNLRYILKNSNDLYLLVQQIVTSRTGVEYSTEYLMKCVSVNVATDTTMLEISVTAPDPELSLSIAYALINAYPQITEVAFPVGYFGVVDNARTATLDSDNSGVLYTLFGIVMGGVVALSVILISNRFKNLIQTSEDLKKKYNLNVLASVSKLDTKKRKGDAAKKGLLIVDKTVGLPFIETFKLVRTKIENVYLKKGYKVFAVTSSMENEGKTTVSVNVALSLAKSGKSVLIIDCDIRKPSVCKALGVPIGGDKGIYDVVSGKKTFEEAIKYVEKYNLYLLVSGTAIADPSEVLASKVTKEVIAEAKKNFDFVIIDCAPAGVVADATIISNYSDAILFVVSENRPSMRQVEYAISDLSTTKAEIFGCVYNNASRSIIGRAGEKGSGYFSRSYGYSKSYGAGYGQESEHRRR